MSGPESRPRGRLKRSDCSGPGISRRRRGGGFSYLDSEGGRIADEDTLERIRGLAIPPAWREVWVCSDPCGHIQATGLDEAGRKQYLYHERWHLRAAQRKFESMREFAAELPRSSSTRASPTPRAWESPVRLGDRESSACTSDPVTNSVSCQGDPTSILVSSPVATTR
jgi:DNA topoisomerase IB